ncbi:MAG: hypothetical protein FWF59_13740 [Turicibacter sp.]|nr:hypothetical protein [Turicibacter sp.]
MLCNHQTTHYSTCNCASKVEKGIEGFAKKLNDPKAFFHLMVRVGVDLAVVFILVGGLFLQQDWVSLALRGILFVAASILLAGINYLRLKKRIPTRK